MRRIPYGRQWIDEEDIKAVVEVLKGDWITQGPKIEEFERKIAEYVGTKYAVAFNSGTSALHASMFAAGVGEGDEVITTPLSFVATSNSILYVGAKPVFVDIDMKTYCMDVRKIESAITERTRLILPVDLAGYPIDMREIRKIADERGLIVVEDAAHALGAMRYGMMVGQEADMTMFSFHPVKHITTGEGGIVVTNNEEYYEKLKMFRTHGITKDEKMMTKNDGPWYYEMHYLGYNYRITDFQCALGLSQLEKLEKFIERRNEIARMYDEAFRNNPTITTPPKPPYEYSRHAYHIYPILLDERLDRRQIFMKLRERGILCQVHYIPIHLQPYYRKRFKYDEGSFKNAEEYYRREITIPLYPRMSDDDVEYVIKNVKEVTI